MRRPSREAFGPLTGIYHRSGNGIEHDGTDVVCYDTETSGKDTKHGQIYQFGYIHADKDLVAHRQGEVNVRRLPYVVPTPGAMCVTGLGLDEIDAPDRHEEFEAAGRIAAILSFPPGVTNRLFVTFNGISYDDPLIAVTLERNMRDPGFLTRPREQDKRHAGEASKLRTFRIDMLNVIRLAVAMAPGKFRYALNEKGAPDMRLESLAQANGIPINAHNAVGDSQATLGLARLVKENIPEVWAVARRSSSVDRIRAVVDRAAEFDEPLWLYRNFTKPEVIPCRVLWSGKAKVQLVDLRSLGKPFPDTALASGTEGLVYCPDCHVHEIKWAELPYVLTPAEAASMVTPEALALAEDLRARVREGAFDGRIDELRRRMLDRAPFRAWPDRTSEEEMQEWRSASRDDLNRLERFVKANDWIERAGFDFDGPRLRDYAARLVAMHADLDAVARRYGDDRVAKVREASAAAFRRPFADADARWATVAEAGVSEEADDAYREWLARAFDPALTHPGPVPPSEPVEEQQSLFRF